MSKRVTFIHASDLHLGAPFRGLRALSSKWANRLLSAIPESYDRMVDAAIARDVDFVVVSTYSTPRAPRTATICTSSKGWNA